MQTIFDTSGSFSALGNAAINNNSNIAFTATLSNMRGTGIFTGADPLADKVIATGAWVFAALFVGSRHWQQMRRRAGGKSITSPA